jgi:hypothetical protein
MTRIDERLCSVQGSVSQRAADLVYRQMAARPMPCCNDMQAAVEVTELVADIAENLVRFLDGWFAGLLSRHISLDGELVEVEDVQIEYLPALFDLQAWAERARIR